MRNDDAKGPGTKGHCLYGSDKCPCQSHDIPSPHQYARCKLPFSRTNLFMVRIIYCIPWDRPCQLNMSKSLPDHFKDMQQRATSIQSPGPVLESGSLATGTANLQSERPKESKGCHLCLSSALRVTLDEAGFLILFYTFIYFFKICSGF